MGHFSQNLMPSRNCGGIAQLGEHLICIQKVAGSIPVASTNFLLLGEFQEKPASYQSVRSRQIDDL